MLTKEVESSQRHDLRTRPLCRLHALYLPNLSFEREKVPPGGGFSCLAANAPQPRYWRSRPRRLWSKAINLCLQRRLRARMRGRKKHG